jgi:hypothetical protein
MTLAEQLGNVGADVGRAVRARKDGDAERSDRALARALDHWISGSRARVPIVRENPPVSLRGLRVARLVECSGMLNVLAADLV